jgi:hypothetical protein
VVELQDFVHIIRRGQAAAFSIIKKDCYCTPCGRKGVESPECRLVVRESPQNFQNLDLFTGIDGIGLKHFLRKSFAKIYENNENFLE